LSDSEIFARQLVVLFSKTEAEDLN